MQRVSGYFLYQVGASIHPLTTVSDEISRSDFRTVLYTAQHWLDSILAAYDLFRLRACWAKGNALRNQIKNSLETLNKAVTDETQGSPQAGPAEISAAWSRPAGFLEVFFIRSEAQEFEHQLSGELAVSDLYAVMKKRAFDTTVLAEQGALIFPADLLSKVPDTAHDATHAGRCLAFELNTAAGFHMHRVNEAVLRKYFAVLTNNATPPKDRTIGAYLKEFATLGKGDQKVLEGLKSLKDLHRNPLMHPEHTIESTDEAVALHGAIQSVVVHMLKAIT